MKRTPILVVAAIFAVEVILLVAASPKPAGTLVRAETLALGEDYTGVTLTIDRPAPEKSEAAAEGEKEGEDILAAGAEPKKDEHPGREVIELEYQGDKWFLKKPIEFPASTQDINRIVEQLKDLDLNEVPATKARDELLLDDKQGIRITAKRDGRPVVDLIVGKSEEGRTFVRKPNEPTLWTVSGLRREDLTRSLDELREHQIFELETNDIVQLTVARGRGERSFVKKGDAWTVDPADENWLVDPTKVTGAVGSLAKLRATKFADGASTDVTGLGGLFAGAMITFVSQPTGKSATTYKLLVGNLDETKENYYVMRADPGTAAPETIYLVSKYNVERVIGSDAVGLDDYREKRAVRELTAEKVKTVAVTIGGRTVTFEKGAGTDEWNPAAGSPFAKADGATITALVRKATTLRADDFLAMPGLRVGDRPVSLKELIDNFPTDIRDAMSLGAGGGTTGELELANVLTQNLMFLEQMARLYAVVYPESTPAAAQAIQTLAGEVKGTFVSLKDPLLSLAAKLAEPVDGVPLTWTFTTEDDKTLTVHIGGATPEGKRPIYTDAPGDMQVYLVGTDKLGDLGLDDLNDLRAAKLFADVPLDRVTNVVFSVPGPVRGMQAWTFTHVIGGAWAAGPGASIPNLDVERISAAVRKVLDLEAVKFVRIDPAAAGLLSPSATIRVTYSPPPAPAPGPTANSQQPTASPAPAPVTFTVVVGAADAEGQRWVRVQGLDAMLDAGIFTVAKGPAADLLFDATKVVKPGAAAPSTQPAVTPGEGLQGIVGRTAPPTPTPAPAPAPTPTP